MLSPVKAAEADRARGEALGSDGYITKPFDIDTLIEQVELAAGASAQP